MPSTPNAQQLGRMARALARLAVFDVAFVRHGNTGRAATDLARQLTDAGKAQCAAAASGFVQKLPAPLAPFALTSPAQRCVDTARLVLAEASPAPELQHVELLYDGMLQPGAGEAFSRVGYAPISAYLADPQGEDFAQKLADHGDLVVQALGAAATVSGALRGGPPTERETIAVFGHAVYVNAAALQLATLRGHDAASTELLLGTNCDEASGFWVGSGSSELLRAGG